MNYAGSGPGDHGFDHGSGAERVAKGPMSSTTRYLSGAAYVDEKYAEVVVDEMVAQSHRAVAPAMGYDVPTVIRHCFRAQRLWLVQNAVIFGILLAGLILLRWATVIVYVGCLLAHAVFAEKPAGRRRPTWRVVVAVIAVLFVLTCLAGPLAALLGQLGRGLPSGSDFESSLPDIPTQDSDHAAWRLLGGLTVVVLAIFTTLAWSRNRMITTIATRLARGRADSTYRPEPREVEQRLNVIDVAQHGNVVLHAGYEPFLGAGELIRAWSIATELRPEQDPTASPNGDRPRQSTAVDQVPAQARVGPDGPPPRSGVDAGAAYGPVAPDGPPRGAADAIPARGPVDPDRLSGGAADAGPADGRVDVGGLSGDAGSASGAMDSGGLPRTGADAVPARVRIDPVELVGHLRRRLAAMRGHDLAERERITGLQLRDQIVASGTRWHDYPLIDERIRLPYSYAEPDTVDAIIRSPQTSARHFLRASVGAQDKPATDAAGRTVMPAEHQSVVASTYLHVAVEGGLLYVELVATVLGPIRQRYLDIDRYEGGTDPLLVALKEALRRFVHDTAVAPARLIRGLVRRYSLVSAIHRADGDAAEEPVYDFGARFDVREAAALDFFTNYMQKLDTEKYTRLIDRRATEAIHEFLTAKGVDTSDFVAKVSVYQYNNTTIGGSAYGPIATGTGATATMTTSAAAAAGKAKGGTS